MTIDQRKEEERVERKEGTLSYFLSDHVRPSLYYTFRGSEDKVDCHSSILSFQKPVLFLWLHILGEVSSHPNRCRN